MVIVMVLEIEALLKKSVLASSHNKIVKSHYRDDTLLSCVWIFRSESTTSHTNHNPCSLYLTDGFECPGGDAVAISEIYCLFRRRFIQFGGEAGQNGRCLFT